MRDEMRGRQNEGIDGRFTGFYGPSLRVDVCPPQEAASALPDPSQPSPKEKE